MSWSLLLKYGLPVILLAGVFYGIYSVGYQAGEDKIQNQWNQQKEKDAKLVAEEKSKIAKDQATHSQNNRTIDYELAQAEKTHAVDVARIRSDNVIRLRDSEQRASLYRAASESGAVERANLASYASQLDRSLTEGIGLVSELRTTVEVRDGQIRALGAQILNDRELMNGSGSRYDGADATSAK